MRAATVTGLKSTRSCQARGCVRGGPLRQAPQQPVAGHACAASSSDAEPRSSFGQGETCVLLRPYFDDDFEVFIDASQSNYYYVEFEMNARSVTA